jgi:hypothetical protein
VGIFTTTELKDHADLMSCIKEAFCATHLDVVVMLARPDAEFDFLHSGGALGLLLLELGLLVLVFAEVHNAAHWWIRICSDFNQIKSDHFGLLQSLAGAHHAQLVSVVQHDAHLGRADTIINTRGFALLTTLHITFLWLSDGFVLRGLDATQGDAAVLHSYLRRG